MAQRKVVVAIESCRQCTERHRGFNGEYRCQCIENPKNKYHGPDYLGDKPPGSIPERCPKRQTAILKSII